MDQTPLVTGEMDAGAELVRLLNEKFPVTTAFWVKDSEEGHWRLYVASDEFTAEKRSIGFGEVLRLAEMLTSPFFDPFQVKLIPTDHPLARAALEVQRALGKRGIRIRPLTFGGMAVDEVVLYPMLYWVSKTDRGGPTAEAENSLKP